MLFNTFDDWNRMGRSVKLGERSVRRNGRGQALFGEDQTVPRMNKSVPDPLYDMMDNITDPAQGLTHRPEMGWSTCPCLSCQRMREAETPALARVMKVVIEQSAANAVKVPYPDPSAKKDAERKSIKMMPAPRVPFNPFDGFKMVRGQPLPEEKLEQHPLQKTTPMPSAWGK